MKPIKENIRKIIFCMTFSVMSIYTVIPAHAASYSFGGSLNYRVLDGSAKENNKFYDMIRASKGISLFGA